jgi:hypothetical protein
MVFNTKVFDDAQFGLCFNTAGDVSSDFKVYFRFVNYLKLHPTVGDLFSKLLFFRHDAPGLRHGAAETPPGAHGEG